MWCGECRPGSERQVMLWGIELTFAFYSDWTQLVFIDPERERLRAQPWHCTFLAHPFIGYNRYDICTICHHTKMDDHLHSYSHTNLNYQKPIRVALPMSWLKFPLWLGRPCHFHKHTHSVFFSFYTELWIFIIFRIVIFSFSMFIKLFYIEYEIIDLVGAITLH